METGYFGGEEQGRRETVGVIETFAANTWIMIRSLFFRACYSMCGGVRFQSMNSVTFGT